MNAVDPLQPRPSGNFRETRHSALVAVLVASAALGGLIAFAQSDNNKSLATSSAAAAGTAAQTANTTPALGAVTTLATVPVNPAVVDPAAADATTTTVAAAAANDLAAGTDLDEPTGGTGAGCTLTEQSVREGTSGDSVKCLQSALAAAGFYTGPISGTFDPATSAAVKDMQTSRDLFVDGIVGRESAISLGIWPDEASLVVHTPKPAPGAKDALGFPLSSVASTGDNMPPLPDNSGSGKRLVYDRAQQRVWAVDKNDVVVRSWLVSGSKYSNEIPGVHHVYSKSETSTAWNGKAILPHMVRWLKTDIGNIGFHGIPIHVADGTPYMTEDQLGTRLSGGCQRQATKDADFVWAFADIGTTVVVL